MNEQKMVKGINRTIEVHERKNEQEQTATINCTRIADCIHLACLAYSFDLSIAGCIGGSSGGKGGATQL